MPAQRVWRGVSIRLPIPEGDARQISFRAAELVRRAAPQGPRKSANLIRPTWRRGEVGVHFPPAAAHLLMLDRGIQPFLMTELEGKTIPIRDSNGQVHFFRVKGVGERRFPIRREDGTFSSSIKWRYPGVAPRNFVEPSVRRAVEEYFARLNNRDIITILRQTEMRILIDQLRQK
jgi:hypothetical protein